jgi:hypothetical protein
MRVYLRNTFLRCLVVLGCIAYFTPDKSEAQRPAEAPASAAVDAPSSQALSAQVLPAQGQE